MRPEAFSTISSGVQAGTPSVSVRSSAIGRSGISCSPRSLSARAAAARPRVRSYRRHVAASPSIASLTSYDSSAVRAASCPRWLNSSRSSGGPPCSLGGMVPVFLAFSRWTGQRPAPPRLDLVLCAPERAPSRGLSRRERELRAQSPTEADATARCSHCCVGHGPPSRVASPCCFVGTEWERCEHDRH